LTLFYGSDLFFSGHTGLPFLVARLGIASVLSRADAFFGSIVLLAHQHYTIDVLAAFAHHPRHFSDFVLAFWPRHRR
jgi:hypothetical protein